MTERERLIELINNYPCMSTAEDCFMESISDDLADYLLANGVIVPPCKVDDEVWFLYRLTEKYGGTRIVKAEVVKLMYNTVGQMSQWWLQIVYDDIDGRQDVTEALLGKTVFLTKEEAEQALRKEDEGKCI